MIGRKLCHFEITAKLGEGGMGEVYRATDTKLGREVAVKVLPQEFVADEERLARFEREAKVLASLSHSNIAGIFEVGEQDEAHFLVMELAEGESLAERIGRGPIPVDEAIPIALQIAEALEVAHEQGIVHRDLKPANVKVTRDGQVKVLDFGLAKALTPEPMSEGEERLAQSPTLTARMTGAGVLLGSAAYMSPEQAKGAPVDKRADIWAFGVVLWEMLTGARLFAGETLSETLAAVLRDPVPPPEAPVRIHPRLGKLLERCLERDPRRRLRDIGEARIALENLEVEGAIEEPPRSEPQAARASRWRERASWVVAALALVVAASIWWGARSKEIAPAPTHFAVTMGTGQTLSIADQPIVALSPDGRKLAYSATDPETGRSMIHLRRLDQVEAQAIPGTEGATHPFFSPDGTSLAFFADHQLKKLSLEAGGVVVTLGDAPNPRGGAWGSDGSILFAPSYDDPLVRISPNGGSTVEVLAPDRDQSERTYRWPELLPGGRVAIFTVGAVGSPNVYDDALIVAHDFETGERHLLIEGGNMARFLAPDKLVYSRAGRIFVAPFDPEKLKVTGAPNPVIDGIAGDPSSGAGFFSVALNGTLAFVPGSSARSESYLTVVDRQGNASRVPLSRRGFVGPRFSPDGSRLAFGVGQGLVGAEGDIWAYSLASGALNRVTFEGGSNQFPVWSPDGLRIAFSRERDPRSDGVEADGAPGGIFVAPADGSGSKELLIEFQRGPLVAGDWSPDGRTFAYTSLGVMDIFFLTPGEETGRLFERDASSPAFSPNGRWLAYQSPASGTSEIFVRSVEGDGKWQISSARGSYPRWSADGRELFYIDTGRPERSLMVAEVTEGTPFSTGPPRVLLPDLARFTTATAPFVNWDVAPDAESFVFVELAREEIERSRIEVILNWAGQLDSGGP